MGKPTGFIDYEREDAKAIEPKERIKNFKEFHIPLSMEKQQVQGARCMNCGVPFCQSGMTIMGMTSGCPLHNLVPEWNDLVYTGNWEQAYNRLKKTNNFPEFTSRVCPALCEAACTCGHWEDPVTCKANEHGIIENAYEKGYAAAKPPRVRTGKKVAIIGSGPAGLTCAGDLAKLGYDVTIFESREKIGGVLRYGIPEFRLPKSILDRYQKQLIKLGIKIRPNTAIGRTLTVDDLQRDGYEAIFIGTGVWKPKAMGIPGESLGHVNYAIDYLVDPDVYDLGDNLVVIGAGNSAMDVARTALRKGVRHVSVFCRRYQTAASVREVDYAKADGVEFYYGMRPSRITDDGVYYKKVEMDEEGNITSTSEEQFFPCSSVIIAISQGAQNRIVSTTTGLEMSSHGLLATDEHGHTTREGIFASGDVVLGARTVVEAVKYSKQVAEEMDEYLTKRREK